MLFSTQHGSPSRYTLLRSVVKAAIEDGPTSRYTRPLSPGSAGIVLREFGTDAIKVLYLPTPDTAEVERRIIERGDDPSSLTERIKSEAGWNEIAMQTPGIYIAQSHTLDDLHAEALELMGL